MSIPDFPWSTASRASTLSCGLADAGPPSVLYVADALILLSATFQIRTLQEQLENGPNTQLARLQQENSILRDALNQATSQVESK